MRQWKLWLLIAMAVALAAAAGWQNSATTDEPYLTLAACAAVRGRGVYTLDHLPLYKVLAGAALEPLRLDLPPQELPALQRLSLAVRRFLHENRVPALVLLRAGRTGMLAALVALLWGSYLLGRHLGGEGAGLWAALAVGCQPLVLGHAFLVHTDLLAAATWVWAVYLGEKTLENRAFWPALALATGLALAAKFSAVYLLLFQALRFLLAAWHPAHRRWALAGLWGLAAAPLLPLTLTAWTLRQVTPSEEAQLIALYAPLWPGWEAWSSQLVKLAKVFPPLAHLLAGLTYVAWVNSHGQGVNFFWGQVSTSGFWFYFPVALVAKITLPLLLAAFAALGQWRNLSPAGRAVLAYAVAYLMVALPSSYNIGARHLLPMVPLLAALGGWFCQKLPPGLRGIGTALLLLPPLVSFPHYLSHFSCAVGGAPGGKRLFTDSNVDWGQDWVRLAQQAQRRGWQPLFCLYLGPDDPTRYGAPMENLLESGRPFTGGYLAVSHFVATVGEAYFHYLRLPQNASFLKETLATARGCGPPVATVGHSLEVYFCPTATLPPRQ